MRPIESKPVWVPCSPEREVLGEGRVPVFGETHYFVADVRQFVGRTVVSVVRDGDDRQGFRLVFDDGSWIMAAPGLDANEWDFSSSNKVEVSEDRHRQLTWYGDEEEATGDPNP